MRTFDLRPGDMVTKDAHTPFVVVSKTMDPVTTDFTLNGFAYRDGKWSRDEFRVNWLTEWNVTVYPHHGMLRKLVWESHYLADPNHNNLP